MAKTEQQLLHLKRYQRLMRRVLLGLVGIQPLRMKILPFRVLGVSSDSPGPGTKAGREGTS